ncbi:MULTISPECIES: AraC family transcriptional regulator [Luteimonas]|uniref:AraC family transcriptional regulator n=1 Tax=Luteimonas TaxID=83614 RepID=UPI000C7E29A7|nr:MULTISPECIES: AraC family transcriptional regulator [Luteimonas]
MADSSELASLIDRHTRGDGLQPSRLPRVTLIRSAAPTTPVHAVYEASLCLVAQGRKQVVLGDRALVYEPATYLVCAVELPVIGTVVTASEAAPYLSMQLVFDPGLLGELLLQMGGLADAPDAGPGLVLGRMTPGLLDAATRLLRLLDTPEDIDALAPLAEREILYRLLRGDQAATLRRIASGDSRLARVGHAIAWLKTHYASPCSVRTLADAARMSPSTFHQHFRDVTTMSPLQYRNQLRLQAARSLMLGEGCDAATAGFRVGYESPSQFSRDYARCFGAPPARDVGQLRGAQAPAS